MQKFIDFPLLFFSNGLFLEPIKLFWKKVHKLARIKKKKNPERQEFNYCDLIAVFRK